LIFLLAGLFALISTFSYARETQPDHEKKQHEGAVNTREGIDEHIQKHLKDGYYFDFFVDGKTGTHYGFSLPVILIDNGLHIFMSSEFDYGDKLVKKGGQYYKLYDRQIYKTDASGTINLDENGFPTNDQPFDLSISKNVLFILFVAVL